MCRVYGTKKPYVRLCYRTHQAGQRVYFEGEPPIGQNGHYTPISQIRSERASIRNRKRGRILVFEYRVWDRETGESMLRYADASEIIHYPNKNFVYIIAKRPWHNPQPIIDRAKSFGWTYLGDENYLWPDP